MSEMLHIHAKRSGEKKDNMLSQKKSNVNHFTNSPVDRILYLQRTVGNQAVSRLMRSGALQAKLRIGQPGDVYEQEADRVADAVMRMPEPGVQRQVEPEEEEVEMLQAKPLVDQITPVVQVQRQEEPEEEEETLQAKPLAEEITSLVQRQVEPEEEEEELQAKATSGRISEVNSNLESHILSLKGGGQPMTESDHAYFEPRFGRDFSQVRVHTDAQAAESARGVNARAFSVGRDVMFGAGQYAPGTSEGRRLMAHELTHVVQQESSASTKLQRKPENTNAAYLFIEDPKKVVEYEKQFAGSSATLTIAGRLTEVKSGTKFGESTFINKDIQSRVYYKFKNTIRDCTETEFTRGLTHHAFVIGALKRTTLITPVAKYEALVVIVVLRPDIAIDIFGNLIAGKSIIDEEAMRGYCISVLFAPLGKIKVGGGKVIGKATDILIDVTKAAGGSAFKELMKGGKLENGKFSEDVLKATIASQLGKHIAKLPADDKILLKGVNDKLRKVTGGMITKQVEAAYEAAYKAGK